MSHHPPEEYNRTFKVTRLRVCARCSGVLLGLAVSLFTWPGHSPLASALPLWLAFLLPLPAVANFVAHEIGVYSSNNAHRILSGVLLGIAVGFAVHGLASHQFLIAALLIAWLAALFPDSWPSE